MTEERLPLAELLAKLGAAQRVEQASRRVARFAEAARAGLARWTPLKTPSGAPPFSGKSLVLLRVESPLGRFLEVSSCLEVRHTGVR